MICFELEPTTDTEITCVVCRGPAPCTYQFTIKGNGVQTGIGVHGSCESELEKLKAETEILLWNLAGCETYAMGYDLDLEPDPTMARPALLSVLKLARKKNDDTKDQLDTRRG